MDYAYRVYKNVKYYYEQINPATLSGAIDVIVVEQPNGDFLSTPFHVRFGKYGVFNYRDKYVDISVNGKEVKDLKMKLGENGIAFFAEETDESVPDYLVTSPVLTPGRPTTDTVLASASRTLERHIEERKLHEHSRKTSQISSTSTASSPNARSHSPSPGLTDLLATSPNSSMRRSKSMVRGRDAERHRDEFKAVDPDSLEHQRKMTLPYSNSVYSTREYRSLPDLSSLLDTSFEKTDRNMSLVVGGTTGTAAGQKTPTRRVPRLRSSKSQALDRKQQQQKDADDKKKRESSSSSSSDGETPVKTTSPSKMPSERKGIEVSAPITIKICRDDSSERSGSLSSTSSSLSSPSQSLIDTTEAARLADGALSDTEVDRHNKEIGGQHGSDVAVWQWGEFPKTRDEQKKEEPPKPVNKASSYYFPWLWGSGGKTEKGKSGETTPVEENKGIYLDELLTAGASNDADKLKRYIGKPSSASVDVDSGNGSGLTTSPSSPSAHSNISADGPLDDKTPTQETVTTAVGKTEDAERKSRANSEIFPMSEDEDVTQEDDGSQCDGGVRYMRSLRMSSSRLKGLGLQWGANDCRFSITTKYQGTTWCACNIYLYKHTEKLVVSDIDGTITKSDVLGHVIPAIGGQWAHVGVAELYTRIKQNGYKLIYLSSRAIGQSSMTKNYLKTVQQDSRVLPDGPVLLAPDSVLVAFRREVILRRPEEFKIAALTDVMKLFPGKKSPFFAGFGNRETDVKSYKAVGIDSSRILIIDPSGTVKSADKYGYKSSYKNMAQDSVDCIFPPIIHERARRDLAFTRPQTASTHTFWNGGTGNVSDDDLAQYESRRKSKKK